MLTCKICNNRKIIKIVNAQSFEIFKCQHCKIAFTYPEPKIPDYEEMDFHSDSIKSSSLLSLEDLPYDWIQLIQNQIGIIKGEFPTDIQILEIGCGEGLLLDLLRQKGFLNVKGIEPSKSASIRAKQRGLNVINSYFDESMINEKFDLVIMSHVLEHINDPSIFISKIASILNPKGNLMLTQTNYKGLIPKVKKDNWYAWVPEHHFWHFTPKSLKKILQRKNFNVLKINYCSLVHPHNMLYNLARLLPFFQDQFILLANKSKLK